MHLTANEDIAIGVVMNKLALALIVFTAACGVIPDDNGGCSMGNLPFSRTITIAPGDPIPPSIINELQDVSIAGARSTYVMKYPMRMLGAPSSSGKLTVAINPAGALTDVVKFISVGSDNERVTVPFVVGDSVISGKISVYGDGAVDITALLTVETQSGAFVADIASGSLVNAPASWSTIVLANIANRVMLDTDVLNVKISNTGGAGTFYVDGLCISQFH